MNRMMQCVKKENLVSNGLFGGRQLSHILTAVNVVKKENVSCMDFLCVK